MFSWSGKSSVAPAPTERVWSNEAPLVEPEVNSSPWELCKRTRGKITTLKTLIKKLEDKINAAELFKRRANGYNYIIELRHKLQYHNAVLEKLKDFDYACRRESAPYLIQSPEDFYLEYKEASGGQTGDEELELLRSLLTPNEMINEYNYNAVFNNTRAERRGGRYRKTRRNRRKSKKSRP